MFLSTKRARPILSTLWQMTTDRATSNAVPRVPKGFQKVLAVLTGFGTDLHGQNPTNAASKALAHALESASLPGIVDFVPRGFDGVKVKAKVAVPNPKGVDIDELKKVFVFGDPEIKVVPGGMRWHSCLIMPALGDPPPEQKIEAETSDDEDAPITSNDEMLMAVAAVRIGY